MSSSQFRLIAAAFTPFDSDHRVELGAIDAHLESLRSQQIDAVFVCGSTGEGALLTNQERRAIAERWVQRAPDDMDVIAHVGHSSPHEARELAAHAQQIGASAVSAVAPFYFRPDSVAALVDSCATIAAGAPDLPFYYYHAPTMTGMAVDPRDFLAHAAKSIPNFAGIKFTDENLHSFAECLDLGTDCEMYFGRDEMLLGAVAMGARGAIGTTYTFMGPLYRHLVAAVETGDLDAARADQRIAREVIGVALAHGGLAAFKAMAGSLPATTRAPLRELTADERLTLKAQLENGGLAERAGLDLSGLSIPSRN
ncbi:MAG: dihydrodipicolinate synthase family protein [Microbacterium gubbeenense]